MTKDKPNGIERPAKSRTGFVACCADAGKATAACLLVVVVLSAQLLLLHSIAVSAGWIRPITLLNIIFPNFNSCKENPHRNNDPELCF
ncbi:MAG: hypothetical protein IPK81_24850 [Rhodospirillales bacterium]|nr:MAG: hypothetical protein IPK81_24850 [Rhodospirillales bacterium]